ncbi:hypothetical protein FSARC_4020 [Fusarium sarcochroum]|uniref:Uncharacterized protein n=1 Tax=Fusarium sarcochroum TaxID=1208366 RepID=A0A8H4XBU3_9HYPO|nr:hypothetical protein FSARC_4020 [Fusarium sarcochroum]
MPDPLYDWKFAGNASNPRCPNINWDCNPPNACASHPDTLRGYCCDAVAHGNCWNWGDAGHDPEYTKLCSDDEKLKNWRCERKSEVCSGVEGFCEIQDKKELNVLPEIGSSVLQKLYSSMYSANTSATYLSFDPSTLLAATQTSSLTAQSEAATSTSTESSTAATSNAVENKGGLSGGAIGGIVAGSIVGVALLGLGVWLFKKRRRGEGVIKAYHAGNSKSDASPQRTEGELDSRPISELPTSR